MVFGTLGTSAQMALPDPNSELGLHCVLVLDALYATCHSPDPWLDVNGTFGLPYRQIRDSLPVLGIADTITINEAPRWLAEALTLLEVEGLISLSRSGGLLAWRFDMTTLGEHDTLQRKCRRSDNLHRDRICRRNFLRWLYDFHRDPVYAPEPQVFLSSPWGTVEGDPFTIREINAALTYLAAKGLIETMPLRLTLSGIERVANHGGSVTDDNQPSPTSITNNFHGQIGNFQLAQANRDVRQDQTINGTSAEEIATLARALAEASVAVGLGGGDQDELRRISSDLERSAQSDQFDEQRVQTLLGWAQGVLAQGTSSHRPKLRGDR